MDRKAEVMPISDEAMRKDVASALDVWILKRKVGDRAAAVTVPLEVFHILRKMWLTTDNESRSTVGDGH